MDIHLNAVLLVLLFAFWGGLFPRASEPIGGGSGPGAPDRPALAALRSAEDGLARDPEDADALRYVAEAYLKADRPALALAVFGGAAGSSLDHPAVAHLLARAYERAGRLDEALHVARSTAARCARALGVGPDGRATTPVPEQGCSERWLPALVAHAQALRTMRAWGVVDPRTDPRAARAYDLAFRRARIASAGVPREP